MLGRIFVGPKNNSKCFMSSWWWVEPWVGGVGPINILVILVDPGDDNNPTSLNWIHGTHLGISTHGGGER